jgi:hypothetical protein
MECHGLSMGLIADGTNERVRRGEAGCAPRKFAKESGQMDMGSIHQGQTHYCLDQKICEHVRHIPVHYPTPASSDVKVKPRTLHDSRMFVLFYCG